MCLRLRLVWIYKIYFKLCQQLHLFFVVIYYKMNQGHYGNIWESSMGVRGQR